MKIPIRFAVAAALALAGRLSAAPVVATQDAGAIHLSNGLVALDIDSSTGQVRSLRSTQGRSLELLDSKVGWYWDANAEVADPPAGATPPKKGYFRAAKQPGAAKLLSATPEAAEVVVQAGPTPFFAFAVDYHYVLRAGTPGVYAYAVVHHSKDFAAATLWQTRFVLRTALDGTFTHWAKAQDQIIAKPTAAVVNKVTDATFRLSDGTVKTKYQNSVYWADAKQYGVLGDDVGLWVLSASTEYHNGGPIKQGQTVHDDVLLRVMQSVHFGAKPVVVAQGETWDKVDGPFLVYVNRGGDFASRWADAAKRQADEAAAWPYAWVTSPQYVHARGGVRGQVKFSDGRPAANARVILSAPDEDWAFAAKGYQFYHRTDADGRFTLGRVIPGDYTLFVSGGDQPTDLQHAAVHVAADQTTELGPIEWKPDTHGRTLWQIGTFDRTAAEFRNGDAARDYQMFAKYPQQFPNDVDFVVGKSDPKTDWNYAQWSVFAKTPAWTVRFDAPATLTGKVTLTVGVASAQPAHGKLTDVRVAVNGHAVDAIRLPKTGTAGYRGGVQDSPYHVKVISFDAALLKLGENTLTFAHADAEPFKPLAEKPVSENDDAPPSAGTPGQIMYDAIRLEVSP